jgi:hypothetical protein
MDHLPNDPAILVSSINMLLRDEEFNSLEALCFCYDKDPEQLKDYLLKAGFIYSQTQKQFRPVGFDRVRTPQP